MNILKKNLLLCYLKKYTKEIRGNSERSKIC